MGEGGGDGLGEATGGGDGTGGGDTCMPSLGGVGGLAVFVGTEEYPVAHER